MDSQQLAVLADQFNDLFRIEHAIPLNVKPIAPDDLSMTAFESHIPEPFRMAADMATMDKSLARSLNQLGDLGDELIQYLRLQSRKIDSVMRFLLLQQDDQNYRATSQTYGGSALTFFRHEPMVTGQLIEIKLFLQNNDGAVYAWGRVIGSEPMQDQYLIKATYTHILDEDREIIVRASLHEQSRQLKRKAELRQQQGTA